MKVIKTLLKYIGWPAFLIGLITGIIFMYNINANRTALYDVKEFCYGEDCKVLQQLYNYIDDICKQSIEGGVYFDGGCVKEDDVEECISNEGYINCIGKKEFEEKESEYYDLDTDKRYINYERNDIITYIINIKNTNDACTEEKRETKNKLSTTETSLAHLKDNVRLSKCNFTEFDGTMFNTSTMFINSSWTSIEFTFTNTSDEK